MRAGAQALSAWRYGAVVFYQGFEVHDVAGIHAVVAGTGPPVLLLHGYPQSHVMWHAVAPLLAEQFTVVVPDLPGYGNSARTADSVEASSKRAMAAQLAGAMHALGHERFAVAGHDRGGRVAYRMAIDHASAVTKLAVLDIIPTIEQFDAVNRAVALGMYHWFLLAQAAPLPERLIAADPGWFLRDCLARWAVDFDQLDPEAVDAYVEAWTPDVVHASCDDYRAGATIDCEIDSADREAGTKITCPTLALWGERNGRRPGFLDIWRRWATNVEGHGLPCGHFLPEQMPKETASALIEFFAK